MAYTPNNRTIELEGFAEFEAQLIEMGKGFRADLVAQNTLAKAAGVAMEPVLETAKAMAHYNSKTTSVIHMRDTLRIDFRVPNAKDKQSHYVNETDAAIAIVSVKKSAVSLANEFGTRKMSAYPFLRPALDRNIGTVASILKEQLSFIIPAYALKLSRRRKK
jgi:HK97 gp10 family phage protein